MKKFICVLISFLVISLSGCAGLGDYEISLPNGYSVIRSSAHMVTINKQESESIWGSALIPAKVVEIAWNDQYIMAKQIGLKLNDPSNSNNSYEIPDETKIYYWILEMKTQKKFGPFNQKVFREKKKELKISEDIVFKSVDVYQKK